MYDLNKTPTIDDIKSSDYRFVEKGLTETSYVQLTGETPWNGTIFQYGNLKVAVDDSDGNEPEFAELKFSYKIIESSLQTDYLESDIHFKNYLGATLQHIITNALESGEYKIGSNDTDDNSSEPITQ
jgi:hypothetical protein